MTVWSIIGIICLVAGAGLLWWRYKVVSGLGLMAAIETSSARDAAALPPGTLVEVKGLVRCAVPLQSEYAQMPCVHYSALQTARYAVHDHDSQGKPRRREESRTIYSNTRSARFLVEDASGTIAVDPTHATTVEANEVFRETQAAGGFSGGIQIGDVTIGTGGPIDQTWRESAIGVAIPIYVLGVIQPDGSIGPPESGRKDAALVVSVKSEEERTKDEAGKARWITIFAIILFVAALACFVAPRFIGAR